MTGRRSRPRAYLALARVSNLPTVWTNVLAGTVAAAGAVSSFRVALVAAAVSLLYVAGMFLNDAFDAPFDAAHRPDRPIVAGEVTARETYAAGSLLMLAGLIPLAFVSARALAWAVALAAAITYYDWRHKRDPLGPLVMGICRGLVYLVAAAAAAGVSAPALLGAAAMTMYVTALTLVAKYGGSRYGWSIKYLLAVICLLDAAVIAINGANSLALLALLGFPLTLVAQRWVSGT